MSDPSGLTQANPHPVSQHRTPREIAEDEAGPIGQPDLDVICVGQEPAVHIQKDVSGGNSAISPAAGHTPRGPTSKRSGKPR